MLKIIFYKRFAYKMALIMLKAPVYIFLFLLSVSLPALSQPKKYVSFPSPNAASFGIFGQIPVNYFNGLPDISIPLYTLQDHGISMPINLSYHASGVHPDFHPGWVGLGWNLSAGGVITRVANGPVDECAAPEPNAADPNVESYMFHYNGLSNDATWNQPSSLNTMLNNYYQQPTVISAPDEFTFNFNGYSGSFFLDHTGTWKIRSSNGKAIKVSTVSTNSFNLSTSVGHEAIPLYRIIDKIELITPDGTTYTFGGTNNSIEFSRSPGERNTTYRQVTASSWFLTKIKPLTGDEIIFNYERDGYTIVSSESWSNYFISNGTGWSNSSNGPGNYIASTLLNPVYLKEIVTPSQTISFTRTATHELPSPGDNWKLFNESNKEFLSQAGAYDYIDIGSEGSKWFKLSKLTITDNLSNQLIKAFDFQYKDVVTSRLMLTGVQEKDMNDANTGNPYKFIYYDDPSFDLPGYVSRKLDHWGFFNNRSFFDDLATYNPGHGPITPNDEPAYRQSREPDANYLKEGTLNKIYYPTGGNAEFVFEANDYTYIANSYSTTPFFSLTEVPLFRRTTGGLRIRKIIVNSGSSPAVVKEYFYTDENNPSKSSGFIGGLPSYLMQLYSAGSLSCTGVNSLVCSSSGTPIYWFFYNRSVEPLSFTSGSHVTYSTVKEVSSDGSSNVYKYTNHDNAAYRDLPIDAGVYSVAANTSNIPVTDMSYTRGKLLATETYNAAAKLLKKVTYQYNTKPERFNDYIRYAPIYTVQTGGMQPERQMYAYKKFYFEPYVTQVTTDLYNQADNNYVSSAESFEYDDQTLLLKKKTTQKSDGAAENEFYKYPVDKLSLSNSFNSADLLVVDEMVSKNVIGPVLETDLYKGTDFLKRTSTTYKKKNNFYKPASEKFRLAQATQNEVSVNYEDYDDHGNLVTAATNGINPVSFKWGYNAQLPVLKVENTSNGEFFAEDFESDAGIAPGMAHTGVKSFTGLYQHNFTAPANNRSYVLTYWQYIGGKWVWQSQPYTTTSVSINATTPIDDIVVRPLDAQASSYTYSPLVGATSQISADGTTTYYEYDPSSRLRYIKDKDYNIVKSFTYNYGSTAVNWQPTSVTRCELTQRADMSYEPTGFIEHEEKDMNPYSVTYNTSRWIQDNESHSTCPPEYRIRGTHGGWFDGIYVTASKSYDDGLRTRFTFRIMYDDFHTGQPIETTQEIILNYGETEKTEFFNFQALTYLEADIISYTHF
jgi:hypothetical protein